MLMLSPLVNILQSTGEELHVAREAYAPHHVVGLSGTRSGVSWAADGLGDCAYAWGLSAGSRRSFRDRWD
jgi:hypothetical protein